MPEIAVLLTCHNRKALTLAALEALPEAVAGSASYRVFLADDGSTDGTAEEISRRFPDTVILKGDGNLFWNRGMRMAWMAAIAESPSFFLWLNDDLVLEPRSVAEMLAVYADIGGKTIIVGKTIDPVTGRVTYGGYKQQKGFSRLRFRRLADEETDCDSMNGNCVLFPASVVGDIGINDEVYRHAFGDNDYGLRAKAAGYRLVEHKHPIGQQEANLAYAQKVSMLNLKNWNFIMNHPKGVPYKEWSYFCRRHAGAFWMVNFLLRYVKMAARSASLKT